MIFILYSPVVKVICLILTGGNSLPNRMITMHINFMFMKKTSILLTLMMLLAISGQTQTYQKTDFGLKSTINSIDVEIQFYSPTIVRVLKSPTGNVFKKESLSVIKSPQKTAFSIKQKGDDLTLKSEKVNVNLNL